MKTAILVILDTKEEAEEKIKDVTLFDIFDEEKILYLYYFYDKKKNIEFNKLLCIFFDIWKKLILLKNLKLY